MKTEERKSVSKLMQNYRERINHMKGLEMRLETLQQEHMIATREDFGVVDNDIINLETLVGCIVKLQQLNIGQSEKNKVSKK